MEEPGRGRNKGGRMVVLEMLPNELRKVRQKVRIPRLPGQEGKRGLGEGGGRQKGKGTVAGGGRVIVRQGRVG